MKNIPIHSRRRYKKCVIEIMEQVIKCALEISLSQWKNTKDINEGDPLKRIFKSRKCPKQHKDLIKFEEEMIELIKGIEFSNKIKNYNEFKKSFHLC